MLLPEKKLCKLIQTASPGLPLMRGKRRFVIMCVQSEFLYFLDHFLRSCPARILYFTAAIADEGESVMLQELRILLKVLFGDRSATEETDLRE